MGFHERLLSPRRLTEVDCSCDFTSAAQARNFDRASTYQEVLRLTHDGTQLQNFTLDPNSLLVDGYSTKRTDEKTKKIGEYGISLAPYQFPICVCVGRGAEGDP
ncbi:mucin-16-like isoform X3 [Vombatus ursinus]|uniref:mucin-16-like isoform X3 n=1 Tax=Vombatus ursinus TaxID=29139 RepID=UPI000FFDB534|nr:mucin-16-like isoform X3 [Vombatus ursinus]